MDPAPVRSRLPYIIGTILVGGLGASNTAVYVRGREHDAASQRTVSDLESRAKAAGEMAEKARVDLEGARARLADTEARLAAAVESGTAGAAEATRLRTERDGLLRSLDDAEKKASALAGQLDAVSAERDKAKKHADELDEVMKLLAAKKVNARRLAGLDAPPRLEAEVLSLDESREPHVLVLRTPNLDGIEEGDKLYLCRAGEGKARETGHAIVERVDRTRGLLSARIGRLDPGEKIVVGDKLTTYSP